MNQPSWLSVISCISKHTRAPLNIKQCHISQMQNMVQKLLTSCSFPVLCKDLVDSTNSHELASDYTSNSKSPLAKLQSSLEVIHLIGIFFLTGVNLRLSLSDEKFNNTNNNRCLGCNAKTTGASSSWPIHSSFIYFFSDSCLVYSQGIIKSPQYVPFTFVFSPHFFHIHSSFIPHLLAHTSFITNLHFNWFLYIFYVTANSQ